jgi:hypothetical protein
MTHIASSDQILTRTPLLLFLSLLQHHGMPWLFLVAFAVAFATAAADHIEPKRSPLTPGSQHSLPPSPQNVVHDMMWRGWRPRELASRSHASALHERAFGSEAEL